MNQPGYLVYSTAPKVKNPRLFSTTLAEILGIDAKTVEENISVPGRVWVPLAHKVEEGTIQQLKDLDLDGLGFERELKRYYPESSMAAQLLGFVGSDDNGTDKGYFGLEGYYDRELKGKDGLLELEKDVRGAPIIVGNATRIEPENGRNLTLWIDRTVQYIAERRLKEGIEKYGAKEGTVTIMDPKTGGILAMASYPSYDPRTFTDYAKELYKNPIVASSYEPGSTFKVLVMSSALDKNLVTPQTTLDETGPTQVGEYAIRTWDNKYHGVISMTQVLEYSSNVGMVFVENKLGKDAMLATIKSYGFGQPTGIDMEEETSPELRVASDWRAIDLATASFGQGIAVTPIQMVRAVSAFANDGWLMEPHLVKDITDNKGHVIPIAPRKILQVIKPETARVISEMMVSAVDNGEAKFAKPKGYRIAGKTGTAQIPVAGHYDATKTIASFVGFAPVDNPKFVMLVTLREPTSSPWGSETAAPLFFNVARDLFNYYGVIPQ
jgi:cell division protein FtsI/penicillin-binding protein 2